MSSPIIWGGGAGAVGKAISANGVNGQVIATDGFGNLTFQTVAGVQPQAQLIAGTTPQASYTANTPIVFPTVQYDTLSGYNTTTGEYTVPYTGFYLVIIYANTNVATGAVTQAYVDGVAQTPSMDATESAVGVIAGSTKVYATIGQKITICCSNSWTVVGGGGGICISFDAQSGAASGGGSGITRSINSISAPTTAGAAANTDYVYFVSGTTTLTLPTAVGNTNMYTVKNTGVATVSIDTTSSQTIDGSAAPITLPTANSSLSLLSNGADWYIV